MLFRSRRAALVAAALAFIPATLAAQTGPLYLYKNASGKLGPGGPGSFTLTFDSIACDETQTLLPDGSTFTADGLTLQTDGTGRGTVQGSGAFFTPGGTVVMHAFLRGFVAQGPSCAAPPSGPPLRNLHISAVLDPIPTLLPAIQAGFRAETSIIAAHLTLDGVPGVDLTVLNGTLEGLVSPVPNTSPGQVTVEPDRPSYGIDDIVVANVVNGTDTKIVALDGQAFCTIVGLERQTDRGWVDVDGCPSARAPLPVPIAAGETVSVSLPPAGAPTWAAGLYRFRFAFASATPGAGAGPRVFSTPFQIGETVPPPPPPTNGVDLFPVRDAFRQDERIVAVLVNDSELTWTTTDHHTYCSVLTLERLQADGSWQDAAPCLIQTATQLVDIPAHGKLAIQLPPEPGPAKNEIGVYRVSADVMPKAPDGGAVPAIVSHLVSRPFAVLGVRSDVPDVR